MIEYDVHSNTPVRKVWFAHNTQAAALAVWTPSTSTKICITDLEVFQNTSTTISFTIGANTLFIFGTEASGRVVMNFQTPIFSPDYDYSLMVQTALSGGLRVMVQGFEMP